MARALKVLHASCLGSRLLEASVGCPCRGWHGPVGTPRRVALGDASRPFELNQNGCTYPGKTCAQQMPCCPRRFLLVDERGPFSNRVFWTSFAKGPFLLMNRDGRNLTKGRPATSMTNTCSVQEACGGDHPSKNWRAQSRELEDAVLPKALSLSR